MPSSGPSAGISNYLLGNKVTSGAESTPAEEEEMPGQQIQNSASGMVVTSDWCTAQCRAAVPLLRESSRWSLRHLSCSVLWALDAEQRRVSAMFCSLSEQGALEPLGCGVGCSNRSSEH